jgi:2,4-dienoyl-CoA reductase-like NADH-dependent reductase (Old Yellow Enzyme family)
MPRWRTRRSSSWLSGGQKIPPRSAAKSHDISICPAIDKAVTLMCVLFSPITLRGLNLSNRIIVSPMCQYVADNGKANTWHLVHLGGLAHSGAGMLCIEATAVEPNGRITPGDLGLWDDATEAAFKPVLAGVRLYSKIAVAIQLAHAGRKGSSRVP